MAISTMSGVQVQDISELEVTDYPLSNDVQLLQHHFFDPGRRTLRVKSFYRLNPGDVHFRNSKKEGTAERDRRDGRHRHAWEKLLLDLQLPLPDSGLDPVDPIGGWLRYHPEGVWYGPFDVFRKRVGPDDRVIVHCHVHTEGPRYLPMQSMQSMAENAAKIKGERPGDFPPQDGSWYVGYDGTRIEEPNGRQCAAWEEWQGRRLTFPDPAIADDLLRLNVNAFPWYKHPAPGVTIKPFAVFNAMGPISSLLRLDAGATLPQKAISDHRMVAVMAGNVTFGDDCLKDLTIAYGSPGSDLPSITADEPSLLWVVRWLWKDGPLADFWLE